jgi:Domain of Unknown Function (DUF1080)
MKIVLLAACIALLTACNNSAESTSAKEPVATDTVVTAIDNADGWESLFDGKTNKGWHTYGLNSVRDRWQIADNTLFIDTTRKEGGDLVTDNEFANFDLQLEWKISKNGNSGIIFYIHEDTTKYKETYKTGPEMQVLDNDGHSDGKILKHRAGDLYDLIKSSSEPVKPVGEWNKTEIISNNGKLDLILNGTTVVSTMLWDDNWKKLIAGSKFKVMPDWGTFKSGKIALQDHGNLVWYRNIRIKKL